MLKIQVALEGMSNALPMLIAEQLRYAGLISFQEADIQDGFIRKFAIYPPANLDKSMYKTWANRNSERMQSFGIVANPVDIS